MRKGALQSEVALLGENCLIVIVGKAISDSESTRNCRLPSLDTSGQASGVYPAFSGAPRNDTDMAFGSALLIYFFIHSARPFLNSEFPIFGLPKSPDFILCLKAS